MKTCATPTDTRSEHVDLDDVDMLVGAGHAGRMLEIGVTSAEGVEFIVHAMAARPKFLET